VYPGYNMGIRHREVPAQRRAKGGTHEKADLTGYDVQTLSLRDIFAGNLPVTADAGADPGDTVSHKGAISREAEFPGDSPPCAAPYTNPVLDNFRVTHLAAAHTGRNSPASGRCLGAYYDDNIARGYVTVDSITRRSLLFPSSANYFAGGVADNRNVLWGDYVYVHPAKSFAQGETLSILVPAGPTDVVAFDEQENPEDLCFDGSVTIPIEPRQTCFPLEAQRVAVRRTCQSGAAPAMWR
jgi:hypothetical protein